MKPCMTIGGEHCWTNPGFEGHTKCCSCGEVRTDVGSVDEDDRP